MNGIIRYGGSALAGASVVIVAWILVENGRVGVENEPGSVKLGPKDAAVATRDRAPGRLKQLHAERNGLRRTVAGQKERLSALQHALKQSRQTIARMRASATARSSTARSGRVPGKSSRSSGPEAERNRSEASSRQPTVPKKLVVFGEGLSQEAIKQLDLQPHQVEEMKRLLMEEEKRLQLALEEFSNSNQGLTPYDPRREKTSSAVIRMIQDTGMMKSIARWNARGSEAAKRFQSGQVSSEEIFGKGSLALKFLHTLRRSRQATYSGARTLLDIKQARMFRDKIYPPGTYTFPGGMNMKFGGLYPKDGKGSKKD